MPRRRGLRARLRVGDRSSARQQVRQRACLQGAAVSRPPGNPAQPGTGRGGQSACRRECSRRCRQPLADQNDGAGLGQQRVFGQFIERRGFATRCGADEPARHLGQAAGGERCDGENLNAVLAGGLAQPQEHDRGFLFRLETGEQHRGCLLQIGVGDRHRLAGDLRRQERRLLVGVRPYPEIDVVGVQHHPGELRIRVRVLDGAPAPDQYACSTSCGREPDRRYPEGFRPRRGAQLAVLFTDLRRGDAIADACIGEGPPALIAVPLLVDLWIVAGQPAQHLSAPMVGALGAARRAVLARAGAGHQIERPRAEAICRAGECAHRTDLHGVAREIRRERLARCNADLLQRTALQQFDERVTRDLLGEPGAPCAQHTPFPVQQHLRGDRDRFGEGAFDVVEPSLHPAVRHGLVLQRAFAALVADRAVQRMVDQQQLHHAVLGLVG